MPNRDYYLKDDADSRKTQAAYRDHLATLLTLDRRRRRPTSPVARGGGLCVRARAGAGALAARRFARCREDLQSCGRWPTSRRGRRASTGIAYLGAAGLAKRPTILVAETGAITAMARLWGETPVPVLRDYYAVRLAKDRAMALPKAFQDAEFAFSGGAIGGATQSPARWSQAIELTGAALTDAVSKPYIDRHFTPATKAAMDDLVANVLAAMDRRLANLSWMTPPTKAKARAKLAAFKPMIGYSGQVAAL